MASQTTPKIAGKGSRKPHNQIFPSLPILSEKEALRLIREEVISNHDKKEKEAKKQNESNIPTGCI